MSCRNIQNTFMPDGMKERIRDGFFRPAWRGTINSRCGVPLRHALIPVSSGTRRMRPEHLLPRKTLNICSTTVHPYKTLIRTDTTFIGREGPVLITAGC